MGIRKFLLVVDDSPEFRAALSYACGRAKSTGGMVALLKALPPSEFEHWSGVRDEIEREQRAQAETLLTGLSAEVARRSGAPAEYVIQTGEIRDAIRIALSEDPHIKVLVLAAASGSRGPGPLISSLARDGVNALGGNRAVPITIVPGDLTDEEIQALV
ncbi:MAG: universal stress protein [Asticcacaulis sp.]